MPELPEVETTKEGIKPYLEGQMIAGVMVRNPKLRIPVPSNIEELCSGKSIKSVVRRAKYILIQMSTGYLLIHLGMSGHLRIISKDTAPNKHDHIDLVLANGSMLRFCDPRRFGLFLYLDANPHQHQLLSHLGPEPLSDDFNELYLYQRSRNKTQTIKSWIMSNDVVVGVGNIYATESLFLAGLHPQMPAKHLTKEKAQSLTTHIKNVLQKAIDAGGTTLRDFYTSEGKPGYFSLSLQVYGRKNQPCMHCHTQIETVLIAGRNSAFCPRCQSLE